jgi:AAA domain, putative AbiEii toxin, Type IV TA system/AAA ATPase domain
MKLKEIEVKNYKIIDDTNPVKIDPRVTALVGKNESGKSAILKTLWKSRNVADTKFDKLLDYPRDRYAAERKGTQAVSVLTFELTPEEIDLVVEECKLDPHHPPKLVIYTTSYLGEDKTKVEVTFEEGFVQHTLGADAKAAIGAALVAIASSTDAATVATASADALGKLDADQPIWTKGNLAALEDFSSALSIWVAKEGNAEKAVPERDAITNLVNEAKQGDPYIPVSKWIEDRLPFFIYFDDYGQLETRIHLPTYIRKRGTDDPKMRTQAALFEWCHLDPEEILQLGAARSKEESEEAVIRRQEKRRALLDSASFSLSGDWIKWWTEKRHKLHFDADGEDLVLQVSDDQNPFPIPFEERSHGFQWFFSFYLVFLVESKKAHKNSILLLDEPGLHLHPTLQSKLIELFERITDDQQLIYTTHLPFLIDGSHLERVRTIYLTGDEPQKAVVSNDVRPIGDRDTLFPLQAALGYSIAQTLFLDKYPVIVEDITDYWLIKTLNNCLFAAEGKQTLNPGTILIPAGGTSRLMPLASIMLASTGQQGNRLAVLLDSDKVGGEVAKRFQDTFDTSASVLMLGRAIGLTEATIEDLIPREDYVAELNMLGYRFTLNAAEKAAPTNVKAMELAFDRAGLGKFETSQRAQVALSFVDVWGKRPGAIPADTKSKALALFSAINRAFAKKAAA